MGSLKNNMNIESKSQYQSCGNSFFKDQQKEREFQAMENRLEMEVMAWIVNVQMGIENIGNDLLKEAKDILTKMDDSCFVGDQTGFKFIPKTLKPSDLGYFSFENLVPRSLSLQLLTEVSQLSVSSPVELMVFVADRSPHPLSKIRSFMDISVSLKNEELQYSEKIDASKNKLSISFETLSEGVVEINVSLFNQPIRGSPLKVAVLKDPMMMLKKRGLLVTPIEAFKNEDNACPANSPIQLGKKEEFQTVMDTCNKDCKLIKGMKVYAKKDDTNTWCEAIIHGVMSGGRRYMVKFIASNEIVGVSPSNIATNSNAVSKGEKSKNVDDNPVVKENIIVPQLIKSEEKYPFKIKASTNVLTAQESSVLASELDKGEVVNIRKLQTRPVVDIKLEQCGRGRGRARLLEKAVSEAIRSTKVTDLKFGKSKSVSVGMNIPESLKCILCKEVCKHAMRLLCSKQPVCWNCAGDKIRESHICWQCREEKINSENHLYKDEVLRSKIKEFKNARSSVVVKQEVTDVQRTISQEILRPTSSSSYNMDSMKDALDSIQYEMDSKKAIHR